MINILFIGEGFVLPPASPWPASSRELTSRPSSSNRQSKHNYTLNNINMPDEFQYYTGQT